MKSLFVFKNLCLLLVLAALPSLAKGYEISISMNKGNDTIVLGHYFARSSMMMVDDTIVLKNKKGVFKGSKNLEKGVYFIYSNKKLLFEIVIGNEQKFGIVADTSDFVGKMRFTSSAENDVFYDFQRYNVGPSKEMQQLSEQMKAAGDERAKQDIRARMQALYQDRIGYIRKLVGNHPGLYVSKFLNTLASVQVPDPPKDAAGHITDSTFQYRWYRAHFFDNYNINDPEMLRTPFYEDKVFEFMTRVIPQHPDSICAEADKMLAKAQANDDIFRCVLGILFNHYVSSKNIFDENVWVHIADKWYVPYASWSTADYTDKLKKEVAKRTPNLISKHAPPMDILQILPPDHFKAAALDTAIKFDLYAGVSVKDFRESVKGKYTAILFWDIGCSHCKKAIQELYKVYDEYKDKGLSVITVQTVITKDAKGKWIDFVNEHNLFGWTNAWSPFSTRFRDLYDVSTTPVIYLLDEKEDIIAKRLEPEQIKIFIAGK